MAKLVFLGNLLLAGYLTGLIWTIQIVHYPSFAKFSPDSFLDFHAFHTQRISLIVALPMVLELGLTLALWGFALPGFTWQWNALLTALTLIVWVNTFLVAIPLHNQLGQGYDEGLIRQLVNINWWRTIAWTVRFGILLYFTSRWLRI